MLTGLRDERRNMLPFEGDRRALRVMLVVAPGRALTRAGDDRGELPLKLGDPFKCLLTIGIQPGPGLFRVSHLRRLSLTETIPKQRRYPVPVNECAGSSGNVKVMTRSAAKSFPVTVTQLPVTRCEVCQRTVAYRPGEASEALTKHYKLMHKDALGQKPAESDEE
jgi:hypothetical protein